MKTVLGLILVFLNFNIFSMSGLVLKLRGNVTVSGLVLKVGDKVLYQKEIYALGPSSFVQIRLDDNSVIMARNGVIRLEKLPLVKGSKIQLLKGLLFVHKNKKSNTKLEVITEYASMGVRGTKFFVSQNKNESYLCVCEGVVEASNKNGKVLVKKSQDLHLKKSNPLKVTNANSEMWNMAKEGFDLMGIDI